MARASTKKRQAKCELSGEWMGYNQRLRVARLILGIKEREAAAAYGVPLKDYCAIEEGRRRAPGGDVIEFACKYDVSLDWLAFGDGLGLGPHLTKPATGSLAILPAKNVKRQRQIERIQARR